MIVKTGIGQDSHRFETRISDKKCIIGGIVFDNVPALEGNSDADVVLHALCNAISGVTGTNILGKISDDMCRSGITDSQEYVKESMKYLKDYQISNVSISIECKRPQISPRLIDMKSSIAELLKIDCESIGITATTGEALTDFGRGLGIQAFVVITVLKE
ncbi:MAG: 2-C-methyl-D-erythritol 2,4-cyclodiphosphate synthase [Candidatus Marinimicrobia bacterium]|nr:2-C-methyl-D-erythritol 2,4-cyclodiphosphate synthase [Candidatus Neomarinimicrobiota bacterium]